MNEKLKRLTILRKLSGVKADSIEIDGITYAHASLVTTLGIGKFGQWRLILQPQLRRDSQTPEGLSGNLIPRGNRL